jgi:hypothetical protein
MLPFRGRSHLPVADRKTTPDTDGSWEAVVGIVLSVTTAASAKTAERYFHPPSGDFVELSPLHAVCV